jgi:hypothetical protein
MLLSGSSVDTLCRPVNVGSGEVPIAVRPSMLADGIEVLAGHAVNLVYARVVGVFNPRVFLVESQTSLRPLVGNRARVLVFIEAGTLRVAPATVVASSVRVTGVARTLLGMQVGREVPWPAALTSSALERLDIRAAVLATSVSTAEGVDLLSRSMPAFASGQSRPQP